MLTALLRRASANRCGVEWRYAASSEKIQSVSSNVSAGAMSPLRAARLQHRRSPAHPTALRIQGWSALVRGALCGSARPIRSTPSKGAPDPDRRKLGVVR
jgi:hypothetical protein